MRAILINPDDKSVKVIDFTGAREHVSHLLGAGTVRPMPVTLLNWPTNVDGMPSMLIDVNGLDQPRQLCFEFGAALVGGRALIVCRDLNHDQAQTIAAEVSAKARWLSRDVAQTLRERREARPQ